MKRSKPAKPTVCPHPATRLYAGTARDDTQPTGKVVWVGCLDCGAILTPTTKETK